MNHFIYAMKSADPAPAAGGDTKSWFEYYKWDVDGGSFVPVSQECLEGYEIGKGELDLLWFAMDGRFLGCTPILALEPAFSGNMEMHYDTRLTQVLPEGLNIYTGESTGRAVDQKILDTLKSSFDGLYPPRDPAYAMSLRRTVI